MGQQANTGGAADHKDQWLSSWRQPLQNELVPPALRCCLLSGGASRRMGRDKALLPHPEGGTWLERSLRLASGCGLPLSLCSGHPQHLGLAATLAPQLPVALDLLEEPAPWEGPLRALGRLMNQHPGEDLLLLAIDLPLLQPEHLQQLLATWHPLRRLLVVSSEGRRHPLTAIYPAELAPKLESSLSSGERSLNRFIATQPHRCLPMERRALSNCNRPEEWPWDPASLIINSSQP